MHHTITARNLIRLDGRSLWVVSADGAPIGERHSLRHNYTHALLAPAEALGEPPVVLSFHESEGAADKARKTWNHRTGERAVVVNLDDAELGCEDVIVDL